MYFNFIKNISQLGNFCVCHVISILGINLLGLEVQSGCVPLFSPNYLALLVAWPVAGPLGRYTIIQNVFLISIVLPS